MFEMRKQRKRIEQEINDALEHTLKQSMECTPGSATHSNMMKDVATLMALRNERLKYKSNEKTAWISGGLALGGVILIATAEQWVPIVSKGLSQIKFPSFGPKNL